LFHEVLDLSQSVRQRKGVWGDLCVVGSSNSRKRRDIRKYLKSVSNSPDKKRVSYSRGIHDKNAFKRGHGVRRNVGLAACWLGLHAGLRIGPLVLIDQCICRGCDDTASGRGREVPLSTRHVRPLAVAGAGLPRPHRPIAGPRLVKRLLARAAVDGCVGV
jgi:hypothetical protein